MPLEELSRHFDPREVAAFVAVSYTQLNRLRARLFHAVKEAGFDCATYVSSRASIWRNVTIGENTFVSQGTIVEHHAQIGDNVVLRTGVYVGHRSVVHDHCFLAPHAAVSGLCEIGESTFFGTNSCVSDGRKVARDSVIGAGAVLLKDTEPRNVYIGNPARPTGRDPFVTFGVADTS